MNGGIIVFVEQFKGEIAEISFEMLGVGRTIAETMKVPLFAFVMGKDVSALVPKLSAADTVLTMEHPQWEMPSVEVMAAAVKSAAEQKQAALILVAGTNVSSGVGTQLSVALKAPYINFCRALKVADGKLLFTSQLFGGKIFADVRLPAERGIVSIYPGSFPPDAGRKEGTPAVEKLTPTEAASKVVFKQFIEPDATDVDITKQNVLIAIGRGIQNQDNIPMAEELAGLLKGAVCASRPVIDQGWLPLTRQVGKSGMIVKPKFYLAAGISGAPEHVEGMKNAELTIAINTDPNAPIFDVSHFGICGDALEILPALTEGIKARQSA